MRCWDKIKWHQLDDESPVKLAIKSELVKKTDVGRFSISEIMQADIHFKFQVM
jgi:hypothetical protein